MSVVVMPKVKPLLLAGKEFKLENFSGMDLEKASLRKGKFIQCNFDNANMSEVDCEGADFSGSTFRNTNLYRANFKDCRLAGIVFEPKDAFGITFTFTCGTFQNVQISQLWWYSWTLMLAEMYPTQGPVKEDIRSKLLALIGAERYAKLKQLFRNRDW